jgi:mevalonate kinase
VEEAVKIKDERVLITTYTESNKAAIRQRFFELLGHVPANVVIMTWFSFLTAHGVKPFQSGVFGFPVRGMVLVSTPSGISNISCRLRIASDIPMGHGYGSSTADVIASIRAAAAALGTKLLPSAISRLAVAAEIAADAIAFEAEALLFAQREGLV